jgi:hypothetical protein
MATEAMMYTMPAYRIVVAIWAITERRVVIAGPTVTVLIGTGLADPVLLDAVLAGTVLAGTVLAGTALAGTALADMVLADTGRGPPVARPHGTVPVDHIGKMIGTRASA